MYKITLMSNIPNILNGNHMCKVTHMPNITNMSIQDENVSKSIQNSEQLWDQNSYWIVSGFRGKRCFAFSLQPFTLQSGSFVGLSLVLTFIFSSLKIHSKINGGHTWRKQQLGSQVTWLGRLERLREFRLKLFRKFRKIEIMPFLPNLIDF